MLFPAELIKKKRSGQAHTSEEIKFLIDGYSKGTLPDYQMSAWLMTVFFNGMTPAETAALTEAMLHSGRVLDFSHLPSAVDKHSTGGVGDKTSMILAPIVAAAGVHVPMIAGRGLGHTGGTLDKLEAIPGFRIGLSLEEFKAQVEKIGVAIIGQTPEICPADKKIYALRDVTATIESLPLICGSIMSKKIAEGISALVLDVKFGSGAFMKTLEEADTLATKLMEIGAAHGKKVVSYLTNMEQPLGRFIGNSLEIGECVAILKNESYLGVSPDDLADCRELSLELAGAMIWLGGKARSAEDGLRVAREVLANGAAYKKFLEICQHQGGDLAKLPLAQNTQPIKAQSDGFMGAMNTEVIGLAGIALGGGRLQTSDTIDPVAGLQLHKKLGDPVLRGETLFTLYASDPRKFAEAETLLGRATSICLQKTSTTDLIARRKLS